MPACQIKQVNTALVRTNGITTLVNDNVIICTGNVMIMTCSRTQLFRQVSPNTPIEVTWQKNRKKQINSQQCPSKGYYFFLDLTTPHPLCHNPNLECTLHSSRPGCSVHPIWHSNLYYTHIYTIYTDSQPG